MTVEVAAGGRCGGGGDYLIIEKTISMMMMIWILDFGLFVWLLDALAVVAPLAHSVASSERLSKRERGRDLMM